MQSQPCEESAQAQLRSEHCPRQGGHSCDCEPRSPPARPGCSRCCTRKPAALPRTRLARLQTPPQPRGTAGRSEPAKHSTYTVTPPEHVCRTAGHAVDGRGAATALISFADTAMMHGPDVSIVNMAQRRMVHRCSAVSLVLHVCRRRQERSWCIPGGSTGAATTTQQAGHRRGPMTGPSAAAMPGPCPTARR